MPNKDTMLQIPFDEAIRLYPDTITFDETGVLPEDSLVRLKSQEIFYGKDTCMHMTFICGLVWKSIASHFMELDSTGKRKL